ncbi:MAG: NAD(P)/FAD-dependent oxidoreductase, partial [Gammaproteobacteria bacterium]|nr:NAD(P)/FAD-dependent oxidoreductase [Gammaproteobacteria bacterium]
LQQFKIIIVGAGFSGICMGIELLRQGITDFAVLEKAGSLGGTWRDNTYPGAECDIPSALYSYSFEHNHKWQYKWSGQQQILKYQHDTAAKYGVDQHIQFGREVKEAKFQSETSRWLINTSDGEQYSAQHIVTAVGQLHHPAIPKFAGDESFAGERFHSANWNHRAELVGKRVAVIGNAASAVQFIPEIAPEVARLVIFQRSANWIVPKVDRPYTRFEQWVSRTMPWITKIYRFNIWLVGEAIVLPAIRGNRLARWFLRVWGQWALKRAIKDKGLIAKLTPDYPIGAKRILFSDNYYPTLVRDNVHLETSSIQSFTRSGILRKDGVHEEFDMVIYATGFRTNPFLAPMQFYGPSGQSLADSWRGGAYAYLGIATSGFPNLHMMYGPNTNLGHTSIIIMIEAQAKYIVQSIIGLDNRSVETLEVKTAVEQNYNQEIQQRLQKLAFSEVDNSWYMDGGKITNNWAGGTREYRRRLSRVNWDAYSFTS